jgi:hypothetical protein
METNDLRTKLNGILHSIASGRSCEQILEADRTLSYHDIFHAVAEAPTTYWDRAPAETGTSSPGQAGRARTPAKQRAD